MDRPSGGVKVYGWHSTDRQASESGRAFAKEPPHVAPARETYLDHFGSYRRNGTASVSRVECLSLACWKQFREAPVDDNCLWRIRGCEHQVIELQVLVRNSSWVCVDVPFARLWKDVVDPVLRTRARAKTRSMRTLNTVPPCSKSVTM